MKQTKAKLHRLARPWGDGAGGAAVHWICTLGFKLSSESGPVPGPYSSLPLCVCFPFLTSWHEMLARVN